MGILIAIATIALGGLAIGATGGVIAIRTHQMAASVVGTIVCYFILIGIPWALLIMEKEGAWLSSFGEAFWALARSFMLVGLLPLFLTFGIAAWLAR
jgi:hypothetical protein